MIVLGIDPGPVTSGLVFWNGERVLDAEAKAPNEPLVENLRDAASPLLVTNIVFEQVVSYGMTVGASVFETVFWTGRFYQAADPWANCHRLPRREVKLHICGSPRAKDSNIRQALIDRFGPVGTKRNPGPLYGVKSHAWSALALAVTWLDQKRGG